MIISTVVIVFVFFLLLFVPSKAFGIVWMLVDLILCKDRKFCVQYINSHSVLKHDQLMKVLHNIVVQILYVSLIIHIFGFF